MKKTIILSLCLLCSIGLQAQIEKGSFITGLGSQIGLLGAGNNSLGFGTWTINYKSDHPDFDEPDPNKLLSIYLSPRLGYFIINNLAVGANVNYSYQKEVIPDLATFRRNSYTIGPFVRYYYPLERFWPFAEVGFGFGAINENANLETADDEVTRSSVFAFNLAAGMAFPLNEKLNLDLGLSYGRSTFKLTDDNPFNYRSVVGGINLQLGLSIFL
ncbi:outer membrane beta-barrel protein [Croceimicrobium sp.]|uniref:outer membrane beta-barrel protein n=1 Tax=Croceimicrobium sp. TaxID=2828340 RepID=UPI003BACAE18